MIFESGDLFSNIDTLYTYTLVTTNLGWKSNGENVMGAGCALEAATRFPGLPAWYGTICQQIAASKFSPDSRQLIPVAPHNVVPAKGWLGCFPTKPLDRKNPALSWKGKSTLDQIEQSCIALKECLQRWQRPVYMPMPGCGNGGLSPREVRPLLLKYFKKVSNLTVYIPNA